MALRPPLPSHRHPLYTRLSHALYALLPSLNVLRTPLHGYNLSVPWSWPVSDAIRRSAVPLHSRGVTEPGPSTTTPSRRTGDLNAFFEDKSSYRRRITHPALTPLMDIEGQVQYLQVLVRLVPTRKPVNQYLLLPRLTGMRALTLAHRPPAKVGHLSHGLTHLPRHGLSVPHHPTQQHYGDRLSARKFLHVKRNSYLLKHIYSYVVWFYQC